MTPTEIEALGDERRAVVALAQKLHGDRHTEWNAERFCHLLDAGAYLEAAMMLVPEGWIATVRRYNNGVGFARLEDDRVNPYREPAVESDAPTPALALCAAIARAGGE